MAPRPRLHPLLRPLRPAPQPRATLLPPQQRPRQLPPQQCPRNRAFASTPSRGSSWTNPRGASEDSSRNFHEKVYWRRRGSLGTAVVAVAVGAVEAEEVSLEAVALAEEAEAADAGAALAPYARALPSSVTFMRAATAKVARPSRRDRCGARGVHARGRRCER